MGLKMGAGCSTAGAGNSQDHDISTDRCSVYPRWRGEHIDDDSYLDVNTGLSPLARGTHFDSAVCFTSSRFIPAGAGNTAPRFSH